VQINKAPGNKLVAARGFFPVVMGFSPTGFFS
jgi:hypothetical protein